eukprot:732757-Hanusia_phi.AAC.1
MINLTGTSAATFGGSKGGNAGKAYVETVGSKVAVTLYMADSCCQPDSNTTSFVFSFTVQNPKVQPVPLEA